VAQRAARGAGTARLQRRNPCALARRLLVVAAGTMSAYLEIFIAPACSSSDSSLAGCSRSSKLRGEVVVSAFFPGEANLANCTYAELL
jgi:hypothetical protein